ncbi:MAG: alkaline phosphatase PhoX [Bacteroidota bacterium]
MNRRIFLRQSGLVSMGFMSLQAFISSCAQMNSSEVPSFPHSLSEGFGSLMDDPEGILMLPEGFSYKIISRQGDKMDDGFYVPGLADGMATFPLDDGRALVIRNHEVSPGNPEQGPFGKNQELLTNLPSEKLYDYGRGSLPCIGGTTSFIYNGSTGEVETQYLSLAGTIRNCAGGPTPWGSWITCEENTAIANDQLEKNHGYNFEVMASAVPLLSEPIPLTEMGRFNHEAVCVDPNTGIVYETEDRGDGLIYRFIPNEPGVLQKGGKLQAMKIKDMPSFDTRNWGSLRTEKMEISKPYEVEWIDLEDVESPEDNLREQGFSKGAARFARGEGMWYGNGEVYFACTNGGYKEHGQIFRYKPSPSEGSPAENQTPGTVEIFVEPNNTDIVESCDNVTIAPNGDLVLCEDKGTPRIVGVSPSGEMYHIAKNVGFQSEFAGSCFSPDGNTLFVNIQGPGLTLAISGPWGERVV